MGKRFEVGDHVTWNSEAGHVSGGIIKVHSKDVDYKGHTHHASQDEPQYEIKSDKTDHIAMHKGSALRKLIIILRILSDKQSKRDVWQTGIQLSMPAGSAFRTRRFITGGGLARIAKAHRDNRDPARVVELLRRQTKPVAQTIAGRIIPGNSGFMHFSTGRLANDAQPRRSMRLQDRVRTAWQGIGAMRAYTNIPKQLRQSLAHVSRLNTARTTTVM